MLVNGYDNKPRIAQFANDPYSANASSFIAPPYPGDFYNMTI
jgi:hypothetical protein